MKFQTLLFDLDGTVTDSGPGILNSVRYALEKAGMRSADEEELRSFIGPPLSTGSIIQKKGSLRTASTMEWSPCCVS